MKQSKTHKSSLNVYCAASTDQILAYYVEEFI